MFAPHGLRSILRRLPGGNQRDKRTPGSLRTEVTPELMRRAGNPRAAWESIVYERIFKATDLRRALIRASSFLATAEDGRLRDGLASILAPDDRALVWQSVRKDRARQAHVLSLLEPRAGDRILDVGCGFGGLVHLCGEAGAGAAGIDRDWWVVREGTHLGVTSILVGDCQRLPFSDRCMTKVVCVNVFEHVRNKADAIAEFQRVLQPGGRLVIYTDNPTHVALRVALRRLLTRRDWGVGYSGFEGGHTSLTGPNQTLQLLQGFTINRVVYSVPTMPAMIGWLGSRYFGIVATAP